MKRDRGTPWIKANGVPPWPLLNVRSKPFVDQTRDFLLSLLFSALQETQAACLPLPRPPHQNDHLPLPSPLKKSSPPSNCLGAVLALKPAWALTAHPTVLLPSPMSDCDTAVTMLPQVPSCVRLLLLCWADVDGLWILPASTERTGGWQNGSLSCARQSRKLAWGTRLGVRDKQVHKTEGKRKAGATLVDRKQMIWVSSLPSGMSARSESWTCGFDTSSTDGRGNVYTDSRYAFALTHIHEAIYRQKGLEGRNWTKALSTSAEILSL